MQYQFPINFLSFS
jgi:hypothetical protein